MEFHFDGYSNFALRFKVADYIVFYIFLVLLLNVNDSIEKDEL